MFGFASFAEAPFADTGEAVVDTAITPAAGAAVLAGAAPTVRIDAFITTVTGAVVVAGVAPNVSRSVTPGMPILQAKSTPRCFPEDQCLPTLPNGVVILPFLIGKAMSCPFVSWPCGEC